MESNDFKNLKDLPLGLITLVGAIGAGAFNLGFFSRIRFSFVTAFSFQEHVVFSLIGAFVASGFLVTVAAVVFPGFLTVIDKLSTLYRKIIFIFLAFSPVVVAIILGIYFTRWRLVPFAAFLYACSSIALIGVVWLRQDRRSALFWLLLLSPAVAFTAGLVVAESGLSSSAFDGVVAETSAGERFALIRLGSDFSIVRSEAGVIHLKRTADLQDIFILDDRSPQNESRPTR